MAIEPDAFTPAWWCRGAHAQTIWAALVPPIPSPPALRRERWETPDGDFLDVDRSPAAIGQPIVVILHGLESSSAAPRVRGLLGTADRLGWNGVAVNFRSCSGEINRLRRSYHAGDTADLAWVIERLVEQGHQRICCVGQSLGGSILLNYLGTRADRVPAALKAAVALSAPFDLKRSALAFQRAGLTRIYQARIVGSLLRKTRLKLRAFPDLVDRAALKTIRTLAMFDDLVTGPVHGFHDAEAYWRAASCLPALASIRTPTLLISALDDPVAPASVLPQPLLTDHPYLTATITQAGGHLGFIAGRSPLAPIFWAQQQAMAFCARHVAP